MEFWFLAAVASSCLVGDTSFPAMSSTSLHSNFFNWTELDDDITEFNNEMPSAENLVFKGLVHFQIIMSL